VLELRVLGPLEVAIDGAPIRVGSPSQRMILAVLAAAHGCAVERGRLSYALWGDDPPPTAEPSLMTYVSRLRAVLGRRAIVSGPAGYVLAGVTTDAESFERSVDAGAAAGDAGQLGEALALWRGPAFGELRDHPLLLGEARRLEAVRDDTREAVAAALLGAGEVASSVRMLSLLVADQPLREGAWVLLVHALGRARRTADALRAARQCRTQLAEVGLDASPELAAAEREVLGRGSTASPPIAIGNVPNPISSFVGRSAELRAIATELAGTTRLVTLTGPGGVGKSRLAIEIAHRHGAPENGPWWCDLSAAEDVAAVVPTIAGALGLLSAGDPEAGLSELCADRRMLLLFDNCEHVVDEVARLAGNLLATSPLLQILVASRIPLGLPGEHVVPVDPLDTGGDSATLFVDRAHASGLTVAVADLGIVGEICRRLDGLPLAIEMAAPWARTMSLPELAGRLENRLDLLRGPPGDRRHRTMREVVGWSYDLLPVDEQVVLARLGAFSADFSLAAAERVVSAAGGIEKSDVVERIHSLVTRSLLLTSDMPGRRRFRLLDTIAEFARDVLHRGADSAATAAAHSAFFAEVVDGVEQGTRGPDEAVWARTADTEMANIRAAHHNALVTGDVDTATRIAAGLYVFCLERLRPDVAKWARRTLELDHAWEHPSAPAVGALVALGEMFEGRLDDAVATAARTIAVAGRTPVARFAHQATAEAELVRGRFRSAIAHSDAAIALAEQAGDNYLAVHARVDRCLALEYDSPGSPDAVAAAAEYRRLSEAIGAPTLLATADFLDGELLLDRDPARAGALLDRAAAAALAVGSAYVAGTALVSATTVRARHGDAAEALDSFAAAIGHWHSLGDWAHQTVTLRNLVMLLARIDADADAAALLAALDRHAGPPHGSEARRLAAARDRITQRLGYASRTAVASDLRTHDQVVTWALEAVARHGRPLARR
jgi:predicted ATPase/DNA-binding SARP family transcriptional activator